MGDTMKTRILFAVIIAMLCVSCISSPENKEVSRSKGLTLFRKMITHKNRARDAIQDINETSSPGYKERVLFYEKIEFENLANDTLENMKWEMGNCAEKWMDLKKVQLPADQLKRLEKDTLAALHRTNKRAIQEKWDIISIEVYEGGRAIVSMGVVRGPLDGGGEVFYMIRLEDMSWELFSTVYWVS